MPTFHEKKFDAVTVLCPVTSHMRHRDANASNNNSIVLHSCTARELFVMGALIS